MLTVRSVVFVALCVAAPSVPASAQPPSNLSAPSVLSSAQRRDDDELRPRATAFLNAYNNYNARLTRSGALVFLSNRDGVPHLYVADAAHPDAPARKLPTGDERVIGVALSPAERTIVFSSDVGGDRYFHIFRIGLDGTGLKDLTPTTEKLHRNPPRVARAQPDLFAFSAHTNGDEKTHLYVQRFADATAREFHVDPRGGGISDLSPDGRRALFTRFNSDEDMVIFEVDVASGRAHRLYPPENAPAHGWGTYSAKGDRVLVATQAEAHAAELLSIDPATGRIVRRYEETTSPKADIDDVIVSPTGDRVALIIDGGNHSELRILDAQSLALERTVATPLGSLSAGEFTKDGKQLTLTESLPNAPSELFVVDAATGVVRPLRTETRPELATMPPIVASIENVTAHDGLTLPTNLYLPTQRKRAQKLPTIVLIHGGPMGSAAVHWNPDVRFFTSLGYAVVEPNIRGSTGFGVAFEKADDKGKRAEALHDVETINRWAHAQAWCDPARLVIMGTSYGGYMTLLALGRQPTLWRAGVDLSGMSDLRTMEKLEDQAIRVFDETEFGILGKEDDLLWEWSPLKYVDAIRSALFVYQGVNDPVTPQNEADQIVRALRVRKVPVEYMLLANEGHGIVRRDNRAAFLASSARFLREHLGL
jgi:dipeptidyl aminopeptidase/acylaminoacyl peptidase